MRGPRLRFTSLLLAAGLASAWFGCTKHEQPPVAPAPALPPEVRAVSPAPRTVFVPDVPDIWAEFEQNLDPLSVTTQNVYLKHDTVRLPITVTWDPATRRIHVKPQVILGLLTTYTVEFSPNLATVEGVPLGTAYLWQFTTTSVRLPSAPFPANRSVESPFTSLAWAGNETTPGALTYEVYAGNDSVLVATRGLPFFYRGTRALVLPQVRWLEHGPTFWSVTIENATVGERSDGPVWRFDTPAADAPVDSVVVIATGYGYRRAGTNTGGCQSSELLTGGGYFCGVVWALFGQPQTMRLSGVRMDLTARPAYADSLPGGVGAWMTIANMACNFTALTSFTTDEVNGHLATGVLIGPRTVRFETDTLITHIQAAIRLHTYFGYLFRAKQAIRFESPQGVEPAAAPVLKLYYFTGNGTMSAERPPGSARGQSYPARGPRPIFPLDPGRVQSVNSR